MSKITTFSPLSKLSLTFQQNMVTGGKIFETVEDFNKHISSKLEENATKYLEKARAKIPWRKTKVVFKVGDLVCVINIDNFFVLDELIIMNRYWSNHVEGESSQRRI